MPKIEDLFDIKYGVNLELNSLVKIRKDEKNSVNFISRTSKNNGLSAVVEKLADVNPISAGTISVSCGGSVLEAFLQPEEYYSGRDIYYLTSKKTMSDIQKLFYCLCISSNKYKYNYGRQANKTLAKIEIPDILDIPKEFLLLNIPNLSNISNAVYNNNSVKSINTSKWREFRYDEIFKIEKGYYNKKPEHIIYGNIPFIGATENNNGITEYFSLEDISLYHKDGSTDFDDLSNKIFKGNCITVSNDGSVGCAFYQENNFTCSHSVNPLYLLNHELNPYIAMFLIAVIELEQFRWNYGRKWRPKRMPSSIIRLPIDRNKKPDWKYMEEVIKSISFSSNLYVV